MARGKSLAGVEAARVAAVYGLGGFTPSYDEFVSLYLNLPDRVAAENFHRAVAAAVAGGEPIPDDWIASATEDPTEASRWRRWDLRRTSRR